MKRTLQVLLAICTVVSSVADAQAQMLKWTDRVFAAVNVTSLPKSSTDLSASSTFSIYGEQGQISSAQTIASDGGTVVDISGGVRVFGNLGVGVAYTQGVETVGRATFSARAPHPLYWDQPRTATAESGDLLHKESFFHVFALYMIPFSEKFDVAVFAGPSFFKLEQDTVGSAQWVESAPPYSTISLSTVTKTTTTESKTGFNVGADVTYRFMKNVGVGGFVRYAKVTIELKPEGLSAVSIPMGGFQAGGGVRVRF